MSNQSSDIIDPELADLFDRDNPLLVLTVTDSDLATGVMDKITAHTGEGIRHRAFSAYVFDRAGRLLLQKRANSKYHFGGLWSNTCCGHAVPNERLELTAAIRLWQEMNVCTLLREVATFTYRASCPASGLVEHEIDHVVTGVVDQDPRPDPSEVDEWRWVTLADLKAELASSPETFTPWFGLGLAKLL